MASNQRTEPDTSWSTVWALYVDHAGTFQAAFRSLAARGTHVAPHLQIEFIHEFLLERAPHALATFRPERGELAGWLFVVFRRFVTAAMERERATELRLLRLDHLQGELAAAVPPPTELPDDLRAAREALSSLPHQERLAMQILLNPGGSVRTVHRQLGISRWRAQQLVESALEKLSSTLAPTHQVTIEKIRKTLEDSYEPHKGGDDE